MTTCVARDARGRWCLRALERGGWVAIDAPTIDEAIALATFVFEGRSRPLPFFDVTDWHPSTRRGLEDARTLDELVRPPPWICAAVALELRAQRRARA